MTWRKETKGVFEYKNGHKTKIVLWRHKTRGSDSFKIVGVLYNEEDEEVEKKVKSRIELDDLMHEVSKMEGKLHQFSEKAPHVRKFEETVQIIKDEDHRRMAE